MSAVEENSFKPPEWLDQKFIQHALKDGLRRGSVEFSDYTIRPATNKGDNYVSQMFRISGLLNSAMKDPEVISLVVKSLPKGETAESFVQNAQLFVKETQMLGETLPAFQNILDEIGGMPNLFAKLYYYQGPPKDLLVLEDLCQGGFRPANRFKGLDMKHCTIALESLATMHAASLEAVKRNPSIAKTYGKALWSRDNEAMFTNLITGGLKSLAEALDDWKDAPAGISQKIRNSLDTVMDKIFHDAARKDNELNVIVHGDAWTNNFMFRYEDGVPKALKFVDFQCSTYCTPVFDLIYFIFTSPQTDVRQNNLNLLLEIYHRRLRAVCKKLNYPLQLSLVDLKKIFFERLNFGLAVAVTIFPITRADVNDTQDLNDMVNETGGMTNSIFKSESFKEGMMTMLPIFIEHGVFDS